MPARYRSNPEKGNPDIPVNSRLETFRRDWTDNRWSREEYGETPEETDREQVMFWTTAGVDGNAEEDFTNAVLEHFHDGLLMEYMTPEEIAARDLEAERQLFREEQAADRIIRLTKVEVEVPEVLAVQIRKSLLGGYSIEGKDF